MQIVFKKKCKKDKVDLNKLFYKHFLSTRWFSNMKKTKFLCSLVIWLLLSVLQPMHTIAVFLAKRSYGPQRFWHHNSLL
jgi:hypothetical protein